MELSNYTSVDSCVDALYRYVYCTQNIYAKTFAVHAIDYLARELKEKFEEMRCLTITLISNGAFPGQCVAVKRTVSGLIELGGFKDFPHLMFSRIWRGAFVFDKDEIRHLKFCKFGYDLGLPLVCINPYHYERTELFELKSSLEGLDTWMNSIVNPDQVPTFPETQLASEELPKNQRDGEKKDKNDNIYDGTQHGTIESDDDAASRSTGAIRRSRNPPDECFPITPVLKNLQKWACGAECGMERILEDKQRAEEWCLEDLEATRYPKVNVFSPQASNIQGPNSFTVANDGAYGINTEQEAQATYAQPEQNVYDIPVMNPQVFDVQDPNLAVPTDGASGYAPTEPNFILNEDVQTVDTQSLNFSPVISEHAYRIIECMILENQTNQYQYRQQSEVQLTQQNYVINNELSASNNHHPPNTEEQTFLPGPSNGVYEDTFANTFQYRQQSEVQLTQQNYVINNELSASNNHHPPNTEEQTFLPGPSNGVYEDTFANTFQYRQQSEVQLTQQNYVINNELSASNNHHPPNTEEQTFLPGPSNGVYEHTFANTFQYRQQSEVQLTQQNYVINNELSASNNHHPPNTEEQTFLPGPSNGVYEYTFANTFPNFIPNGYGLAAIPAVIPLIIPQINYSVEQPLPNWGMQYLLYQPLIYVNWPYTFNNERIINVEPQPQLYAEPQPEQQIIHTQGVNFPQEPKMSVQFNQDQS